MAVRADANSEYLNRTTGGFYSTSPLSACFWANLITDRNVSGLGWMIVLTPGGDYLTWYNASGDGTTFLWEHAVGAALDQLGSFNLSLNTWYFFAITRNGTGAGGTIHYRRAATETSFTTASGTFSGAAFTPNDEYVLSNWYDLVAGWFAGRIAALKQWNAILTVDELMQESYYFSPIRWTNLQSWHPFVNDGITQAMLDFGPNGRNFSQTGTLTIEDGPPIIWMPSRRKFWSPAPAIGAPEQMVAIRQEVTSGGMIGRRWI